ncbi:MAG TPA: hypothetical protein VG186_12275 [Solirubrobacteraceae bacterium]|jgi:hypothetical protein|nr:hypothetical protein [Solirubrobacteraceae bacterium]
MTDETFSFRGPGFLAAVLPWVSGIASYGLTAWSAAASGNRCGEVGTGVTEGVALLFLIAFPPALVTYRAVVARKSWPVRIGLLVGVLALTYFAICVAAVLWAGGHDCWG